MQLTQDRHKIMLLHYWLEEHSRNDDTERDFKVTSNADKVYTFRAKTDRNAPRGVEFPFTGYELKQWCTKVKPKELTLQKLDQAVVEFFPKAFKGIEYPVTDERITSVEFGSRLEIESAKARYIIDRQYAYDLPSFNSLTGKHSQLTKFVAKNGGVFRLYRHDFNNFTKKEFPLGVLLRSTLSIRYPVPYGNYSTQVTDLYRVRCKLNIPNYNGREFRSEYFKYDGYVTEKKGSGWWHWLFQGRGGDKQHVNDESDDLILMYTKARKTQDGLKTYSGVMLTQTQEKSLVPTLSKVFLVKMPGYAMQEQKLYSAINPRTDRAKANLFYKMVPDEAGFMEDQLDWFDLSGASSLDDFDSLAIKSIYTDPLPININGLHVF